MTFLRPTISNPIWLIPIDGVPIPIVDLHVHRVSISDTSRIVELSPIGSTLNKLQSFGTNSRKVNMSGRLDIGSTSIGYLRALKNQSVRVLLFTNTAIMVCLIKSFNPTEDKDLMDFIDYSMEMVESASNKTLDQFLAFTALYPQGFSSLAGSVANAASQLLTGDAIP